MLKSQQSRAVKKAPRRRPYSCDACPKQFETPSKLARHYLTHTGQKPFQCQDCRKTFRQLVHLERHMMTHTLQFQCSICHRHFKNADTFSKHQLLHIEGARLKVKVPKKPVGPRRRRCLSLPLYCFGCQRTFESEEKRLLHQCDFVNVTANRRAETQQCSLCNKVFPSRSKLERHIMIHTGQKPFACVLCGKAFRQKAHLKIHELTHTQEKPFQCTWCFKAFKTAEQLLKHEEAHKSVPAVHIDQPSQVKEETDEVFSVYVIPFQCSACDQCFDSQEILDSHVCGEMNTQVTVSLPIKSCGRVAGKQIKRQEILGTPFISFFSRHKVLYCQGTNQERQLQKIRTRAVQKRYRCSVCSKNFLSPSKLDRHHLTHSGQRPFVCQECGKSFRQDPHLKRHMVTHVKMME
uniref:C2H2-type domain-containing protein n=1 Tax=Pyxicephalus adspersus TaxID=30357 RepID=A0AAV2ZEA2_PYXAD|nr:TPA: hypothetical protein GDO54_005220 [Pyxicephalus adspersus]